MPPLSAVPCCSSSSRFSPSRPPVKWHHTRLPIYLSVVLRWPRLDRGCSLGRVGACSSQRRGDRAAARVLRRYHADAGRLAFVEKSGRCQAARPDHLDRPGGRVLPRLEEAPFLVGWPGGRHFARPSTLCGANGGPGVASMTSLWRTMRPTWMAASGPSENGSRVGSSGSAGSGPWPYPRRAPTSSGRSWYLPSKTGWFSAPSYGRLPNTSPLTSITQAVTLSSADPVEGCDPQ